MTLRMSRVRENAPIILNLIKDSGWAYTFGIVSVVAFIPVLSFQCYELWKDRKEGAHKIALHLAGAVAICGNAFWMIEDIFCHDHFRPYVKWVFDIGFVLVGLFFLFTILQKRKEKKGPTPTRIMAISQETRGIVFVHARGPLGHIHRPATLTPRSLLVRRRHHR